MKPDLGINPRVLKMLRQARTLVNEKYSVGGRLKIRRKISLPKIKEFVDADEASQRREPK
jgi:hypothetical protein